MLSPLHRVLRTLSLTSFNIILLVCFFALLFLLDQTKDIVLQLEADSENDPIRFIGFFLGICWFSFILWWTARWLIDIAYKSYEKVAMESELRYSKAFDYGGGAGLWIPRLYAMIPALFTIYASYKEQLFAVMAFTIMIALVILYVLKMRTKWQKKYNNFLWQKNFWITLILVLYITVLILAIFIPLLLGKTLGAFFIIFWALGSMLYFLTIAAHHIGRFLNIIVVKIFRMKDQFMLPPYPVIIVIPLMLIISIFFEIINHPLINSDNHHIRRESLLEPTYNFAYNDFETAWDSFIKRDKALIIEQTDSTKVVPVYFVLSQGGGLRAAYWTAIVLSELEASFTNFHQNVFSLTGASGGIVGSLFFSAALNSKGDIDSENMQDLLLDAVGQDYLSGITTSFLFNDMLNRFVPNSLFGKDRATYLERDWENGFYDAFGKHSHCNVPEKCGLKQLFQRFYHNYNHENEQWMPLLISTSTIQESGSRALMAPFPIDSKIFPDKYDLYDLMNCVQRNRLSCDMRLSTVGTNSSRFPYITPAGTVNAKNSKVSYENKLHILDGGYYDNFGAQTTLDMFNYLYKNDHLLTQKIGDISYRYQPVLIIIANDQMLDRVYDGHLAFFNSYRKKPLATNSPLLNEIRAPIQGLFNLQGGHTKTHIANLLSYQDMMYTTRLIEFTVPNSSLSLNNSLIFHLKDRKPAAPLGWWLSDPVMKYMRNETKSAGCFKNKKCSKGKYSIQEDGEIYLLIQQMKNTLYKNNLQ